MTSNDEKSNFGDLFGEEVEPLKASAKVKLAKDKDDSASLEARREAASDFAEKNTEPEVSDPMEMLDPLDILSFQRPGVQHGVFRNLRLGKYALDARLDLHRMKVEQARREVQQFVKDCLANDVRCALITHGKGEGRERQAVLKSCIAHWLPQLEPILAFHTAQKQHGGYGATYILVKKSETKKEETRRNILNKV